MRLKALKFVTSLHREITSKSITFWNTRSRMGGESIDFLACLLCDLNALNEREKKRERVAWVSTWCQLKWDIKSKRERMSSRCRSLIYADDHSAHKETKARLVWMEDERRENTQIALSSCSTFAQVRKREKEKSIDQLIYLMMRWVTLPYKVWQRIEEGRKSKEAKEQRRKKQSTGRKSEGWMASCWWNESLLISSPH